MRAKQMFLFTLISCGMLFLGQVSVQAQQPTEISISTPQAGTQVTGSTLTVIASVSGPNCKTVTIGVEGIGSARLTQAPYQATIAVPENASGPHKIAAFCLTANNLLVSSPVVEVSLDAGLTYLTINAAPHLLVFSYPGMQLPLHIEAKLSDGKLLTVTKSPSILYTSDSMSVASVDAGGVVTAIGPGSTTIRAKTGNLEADVSISVPKLIPGDLNGDGQVDLEDINILDSSMNIPANSVNDARDLNHDGKIDALDARILVTLCTYPRCATHP